MRAWAISSAFVLWFSGTSVLAEQWYRLYNQAVHDLEAGRYEAAITKLQAAIKQKPKSGPAITVEPTRTVRYFPYFLLGKAYFHARQYDEASKYFEMENDANLPDKLYASIVYYQAEIKSIRDTKREEAFDGAVTAAEAARKEKAFEKAASQLEMARQADPAEFDSRGLEKTLTAIRDSEKQQAAEAERQKTEAAFQALVNQASEKEKLGALGDTTDLVQQADRLIPNRREIERLRTRLKDRESKYAEAKQAATTAEREGRLADAVKALKQAEQANPESYKAEQLAAWGEPLARQLRIQQQLDAGSAALDLGQFAQAVEHYEAVLQDDPENMTAKPGKSRARFLQLMARGDELASQGSFADALEAFQLAATQNAEGGSEIYEKMRFHLDELPARRSSIRTNWLEVMRNSDPGRFSKEHLGVVDAHRRWSNVKVSRPSGRDSNVKRGVLAALSGEPQKAVQMLEKATAGQGTDNADLESWTGVAYARLSFLTADPKKREALQAQAIRHFRRALDLNPRYALNSRLVPPRIIKLFAEAKR